MSDTPTPEHKPKRDASGNVTGCVCGTTREVFVVLNDEPARMEMHSSSYSLRSAMGRDSAYSVFLQAPNGEYWNDENLDGKEVVILNDGDRYYTIPPVSR